MDTTYHGGHEADGDEIVVRKPNIGGLVMAGELTIRLLFPALALSIAGCGPGESGKDVADAGMVIEVLKHGDEGPESVEELTGIAVGAGFDLSGTEMMVTDRWEHAVSLHETSDDNPEERHAFEITWPSGGSGESRQWLHQADPDAPATMLDGVEVAIRIAPPGARPAAASVESFAGQVQFLHQGLYYDLVDPGAEVLPGWTLKSSRQFQRALLGEDGELIEEEDDGFVNRVLEVHISSEDGSEERHIVFLDHPELTKGIHPTILPVSRVSGEKTSLTRLVVCPPMPAASEQHQVWVTPGVGGSGSRVRVARKGRDTDDEIQVTEMPAEIELVEDLSLRLVRHFRHAKAVVRWERADVPEGEDARPALVVETWDGTEAKSTVLIEGEITPCRIKGEMVMLRFRGAE